MVNKKKPENLRNNKAPENLTEKKSGKVLKVNTHFKGEALLTGASVPAGFVEMLKDFKLDEKDWIE